MPVRGIRGATVTNKDDPRMVLAETTRLLGAIQDANPYLRSYDIGSIFFSMTSDLTSVFPAQAAREMGWDLVPMLCFQEIPVPGSLPFCIRVLIHWNTDLQQSEIHHVYLNQAKRLRPDLEPVST